jgi:hypothetical protein
MARRAENARRRELEESYHGLKKRIPPRLFNVAADEWLSIKKPTLAERSYAIEGANLKHLRPTFGKLLITDIDGKGISQYQQERLKEEASPKTVIRMLAGVSRCWGSTERKTGLVAGITDRGAVATL